jgi:hypothetical protein
MFPGVGSRYSLIPGAKTFDDPDENGVWHLASTLAHCTTIYFW